MSDRARTEAVPEMPFWLEVNGRRVAIWTCTPGELDALAVGRLLAEGYIDAGDRLPDIEIRQDGRGAGASVRLSAARVQRVDAERDHRRGHGCGIAHVLDCGTGRRVRREHAGAVPDDVDVPALFRALFAGDGQRRGSGGVHAAALTDGRGLPYRVEDVGRHNAVDKVIGRALLDGEDPRRLGLLLTSRVSGEIALKAARAGIAWIASRSVPTTLAVEIAAAAGIPILARAAAGEPRLYPAPAPAAAAATEEEASS